MYDYTCFSPFFLSPRPFLLRTDWLWNVVQFALPVTFQQLRNLLCSEWIWTKSVACSQNVFTDRCCSVVLLLHETKGKDALANWSCQEIDFSVFDLSCEPQRVPLLICFEKKIQIQYSLWFHFMYIDNGQLGDNMKNGFRGQLDEELVKNILWFVFIWNVS